MHLLIISCETISSDAILPISLKVALADRQNSFFACGKRTLSMCEGERSADDVLATRQEGLQQTSADLRQVITSCSC